jgi:hypothetical protein
MFGDSPKPHEVVLLGIVGLLVDVLLVILVIIIILILIPRVVWVVASGCRSLNGWCNGAEVDDLVAKASDCQRGGCRQKFLRAVF